MCDLSISSPQRSTFVLPTRSPICLACWMVLLNLAVPAAAQDKNIRSSVNVDPKPISADKEVKYDYDIVYVRAPRRGDDQHILWAEVFAPLRAEPGSDLMLLHPDG